MWREREGETVIPSRYTALWIGEGRHKMGRDEEREEIQDEEVGVRFSS